LETFIQYFYVLNHLIMKNIFLLLGISLLVISSCSRFKMGQSAELSELSAKVDSLKILVDSLSAQNKFQDDEISWLEIQIGDLTKMKESKPEAKATAAKAEAVKPAAKPVVAKPAASATTPAVSPSKSIEKAPADLQCIAITNTGKRCSRPAIKGSKYCLQHKQIYEPDKPDN